MNEETRPSAETWHRARLIPTSGIDGAPEQERRATSALLSVLAAVKELGRALTQPLGAPVGAIQAFVEVPFTPAGKTLTARGLIQVRRGPRTWTALVDVRTGSTALDGDRLEAHLEAAREQGFDAVLTISNEIAAVAGQHPVAVDKAKLHGVALFHYSWSHLLAEAVTQKEHRGVADSDQAWVLGELIRYLEHPRSGALEFEDMGAFWEPVRAAVAAGGLRAIDPGVLDVIGRFDALLRYASLRLGRRLGADVVPLLSQRELADPSLRTHALRENLATEGTLAGAIRIPDAIGPVVVTADLRSGRVTCHVDVDAPREGRPAARIDRIVRQLRAAPPTTRIEARVPGVRGSGTGELLRVVRENSSVLVSDPEQPPRAFRISLEHSLGTTRGRGRGSFIDSVLTAVDAFHGGVVQGLRARESAPDRARIIDVREGALRGDSRPESVAVPHQSSPGARPVQVQAPPLPSRRDVRVVRQLGGSGPQANARPEAGWYQDPKDSTMLRWWDGEAWSERTYPGQPALA